ncbi:MAG: PIF1 family DEAD/DEAH box helicase [Candidatus Staskawiczbacteria bacterium]|jgi:ATP-dependent exoDNAse (exonuclease V) alpha subunit
MKQKEAFDILKSGYNTFLTGPPGSGKTFLLNNYIKYLKKNNVVVSITASTGIAATHMGGVTLHSWSGLGIRDELDDSEVKKACERGYIRKRIKNTGVLIIDEISMIKASQFEAVNKICQYIKRSPRPFGGIQVVCSGDFFQLPPVYKNEKPKSIIQGELFNPEQNKPTFVTESGAWKSLDMKVCYLDEQYRTKDKQLTKILNHIREDQAEKSKKLLFDTHKNKNEQKRILTKLYTHNIDVDTINYNELNKIKGKEYYYQMTSRGNPIVSDILKKSCLAPEKLILKEGAHVMFIKNNFEAGYVNGTQGKVVGFVAADLPVIQTEEGKKITVTYADWTIEEDKSIIAGISQIPLRLAWAITVHKSQGMNLDSAEMDLSKCFLPGMGYVALSRLKSLKGLNLLGINNLAFCVNQKAIEVDKNFKKLSKESSAELKKISSGDISKRQKLFIKYLGG